MIPASVQAKVKRFDSALRLREKRGHDHEGKEALMIVLERRGRDGSYQTIGWVRPDLLGDGSMLLNKLHASDVRRYGSGEKAADAFDEADRNTTAQRHAERRDRMEQIGKTCFEHMQRRCGERINNVGLPE